MSIRLTRLLSSVPLLATLGLAACGGGGDGGSGSTATTTSIRIYAVGASYSSDGSKGGTDDNNISGDARFVNGPIGSALWLERYATTLGALTPVSNTRTASSGQSATNYARGGSYALGDSNLITGSTASATSPTTNAGLICQPTMANTGGADCGLWSTARTKYAANAYDQWLLIKAALGAAAPGSSDVLTIDAGGNDLVAYHEKAVRTAAAGDPFVSDRADVIEKIAQEAATQGFKKIVIAKIPPLNQLTGVVNMGWGATRLGYLGTDVAALNSKLAAKITTAGTGLKAVNAGVSFYLADWHTAIANALATPSLAGVTSNSSDAGNLSTTASASLDAFWWDTDKLHPSAKIHRYMADNFIALQ